MSSENTVFWEINFYKVFNCTNILLCMAYMESKALSIFFTSKTTDSFDF